MEETSKTTTNYGIPASSLVSCFLFVMEDYQIRIAKRFLPFGFEDVDSIAGGMRKGTLTLVCGDNGAGKTAFLAHVALDTALRRNGRVFFFSLLAESQSLTHRFISDMTGTDSHHTLGKEHVAAAEKLRTVDITVFDGWMSTDDLVSEIKKAHTEQPLTLAVVDDIRLLQSVVHGEMKSLDDDFARYTDELSKLRKLAEELNIPLLLSNKGGEPSHWRGHSTPTHHDTWLTPQSTALFDTILILHREWLNNMWTPHKHLLDVLIAQVNGRYCENVQGIGVTAWGTLYPLGPNKPSGSSETNSMSV